MMPQTSYVPSRPEHLRIVRRREVLDQALNAQVIFRSSSSVSPDGTHVRLSRSPSQTDLARGDLLQRSLAVRARTDVFLHLGFFVFGKFLVEISLQRDRVCTRLAEFVFRLGHQF